MSLPLASETRDPWLLQVGGAKVKEPGSRAAAEHGVGVWAGAPARQSFLQGRSAGRSFSGAACVSGL